MGHFIFFFWFVFPRVNIYFLQEWQIWIWVKTWKNPKCQVSVKLEMLSWLPPILQPSWVDTVSKAASICHPHQVGSLSPSEQLTVAHFSLPLEDALEHWADPDWKPPLVHCYNASLAQVPAATLRTGDPMSSVSLHFPPHLTYTPTCSLRAQALCHAAGSSWYFLFLASKYVRS